MQARLKSDRFKNVAFSRSFSCAAGATSPHPGDMCSVPKLFILVGSQTARGALRRFMGLSPEALRACQAFSLQIAVVQRTSLRNTFSENESALSAPVAAYSIWTRSCERSGSGLLDLDALLSAQVDRYRLTRFGPDLSAQVPQPTYKTRFALSAPVPAYSICIRSERPGPN